MMQVKASRIPKSQIPNNYKLIYGNTSNDGRDGVEDQDTGIKLRPGIQNITNGEEGKSVDRG